MDAVTVILVTNVTEPSRETKGWLEARMEAPLAGPVLAAIKSVEEQTYPNVHLSVVRNIEEYPLADMQRVALQRTMDPYVAFMEEDEEWVPEFLAVWVAYFQQTGKDWVVDKENRLRFARREMLG